MAARKELLNARDKSKIEQLYVSEKMTIEAIRKRYGVSNTTITKALDARGVKRTGNANRSFS